MLRNISVWIFIFSILTVSADKSEESIILIGGASGVWPINNVTILTSSGDICPLPSLPIPLADHFSVGVLSKILTCGGRSRDSQTLCWWLDLQDIERGWVMGPRTNTGRSYGSALVFEGDVWVTGGYDGKTRQKSTEILKFGRKSWAVGTEVTRKRYQHCGVTLDNGNVILTGGHDKAEGALDLVERYRWNGGLMEELPRLNQPRWTHACTAFTMDGKEAVIVAGGQISNRPRDSLDSVEIHVLGSQFWSYMQPLPQARRAPFMVVVGGSPLLTGGMFATGYGLQNEVYPNTIVKYNSLNNTWSIVAELRGKLADHKAVAVEQKYIKTKC